MDIFEFSEYRAFVKHQVKKNKGIVGYKAKLAKAAGCHPSFLSQALGGKVHLTPDHALGLADYWELTPVERDYFLDLVNLSRAASARLKNHLQAKLDAHKRNLVKVALTPGGQQIPAKWEPVYYSSWMYGAIRMALYVPELRTAESLSERFKLPRATVLNVLEALVAMGQIEAKGGRWENKFDKFNYTSHNSLASHQNFYNWANKASTEFFTRQPGSGHFYYVRLKPVSQKDYERLRKELIALGKSADDLINKSSDDELVCMGLFILKP